MSLARASFGIRSVVQSPLPCGGGSGRRASCRAGSPAVIVLTAILGSTDLLLEELAADHPGRLEAQETRKAALRAADLTRQLLAFSRQQVLAPQVLDINEVVTNVDNLLHRVIGEHVELRIVRAPDLGAVRADPGQLEQVLLNLAVNARDAMPRGGRLTIETANADLDETYAAEHAVVAPGRYVMFAVSDTGTGMDAETQTRLFEPFFTTKEKGKGTGLGLATVYGIVKQSGGYIWVYSEPGQRHEHEGVSAARRGAHRAHRFPTPAERLAPRLWWPRAARRLSGSRTPPFSGSIYC